MSREIEIAQKRVRTYEVELKEYRQYANDLRAAVDLYLKKKYAPLERALAQYGTLDEIQTAYGYGYISKKRYKQIVGLAYMQQDDPMRRLFNSTEWQINVRISELEACVKSAQHELNTMMVSGGDDE